MGLFSGEPPERQTADLDPISKKLIEENVAKAQAPIDESRINRDIQMGQNVYDQGLIGGGMSQAIKQKYGGLLAKDLDFKKSQLRMGARDSQLQQLKRAQNSLIAQQNVQNDIFSKALEANMMRESARSEALMSILGLGGQAAGMKIAQQNKQEQNKIDQENQSKLYSNFFDNKQRAGTMGNQKGYKQSQDYRATLENIGDFENYG